MTSMAKIKTSEVAKRIALEGLQMMGGYGYATSTTWKPRAPLTRSADLRRHQRDSARNHQRVAGPALATFKNTSRGVLAPARRGFHQTRSAQIAAANSDN